VDRGTSQQHRSLNSEKALRCEPVSYEDEWIIFREDVLFGFIAINHFTRAHSFLVSDVMLV
jgi:hypothetical protein